MIDRIEEFRKKFGGPGPNSIVINWVLDCLKERNERIFTEEK